MKTQTGMECWASILTATLGTTKTAQLLAPHAGRTLPQRKFLATHFCYRLSKIPVLVNVNRRNVPFESF